MSLILILNDNRMVLEALGGILEQTGHEVLVVDSNESALSILHSQPIDLLVQDIQRPGMNGWQFARLMKSDNTLCRIPILIVSGDRSLPPPDLLPYIDDYLPMPFDPETLLDVIERILKNHQRHGRVV